ncbi:glycosyltransferase [Haloarcula salinisoli]|uniref:Glycosyltransferase n=1 Tax=Haloarcula salinisoli TaxID=2487746 RepID=A0A8J7YM80_9EURY|nr:glycosyltransferase [Halomicroarcula salinisoli]MBX0288210.1 glycosyltransferase [Halomicroarcula salinisoli]MBX0305374.1 glycosyltransferase [Halomicroarcula salinisoli]
MDPIAALAESADPTMVLSGLAVFLAVVWTFTNLYNYYPVVRSIAAHLLTGTSTDDAAFLGTDRVEIIHEDAYPEIDVFIPAYQEHEVIHQAIRSIRDTDYIQEKINLTVLLEPDDEETIARVESLQEEVDLDLLLVPDEYPGSPNKPRALNYGYEQTDADIVGVIDAENVVAPDLFERVASAFVAEGRDYVQGTVDMANEDDGWKNLLFRAEYGYWYRFIVPAFKRLGFPIPLSGTTCFFGRETLKGVSEQRRERKGSPWSQEDEAWLSEHGLSGVTPWDPENVTEDFEVGLALWLTDENFGLVDSTTREESPQELGNWLKQRTRWQKGKLYTFLDFFRNPAGSSKERAHLLWQSFLPHVGPLNVLGIFLLIGIGSLIGFTPQNPIVAGMLLFTSVFFFAGLCSFGLGYWFVSTETGVKKLLGLSIVVLTVPFYWVFQWAADIRASKQILLGDLGWEKTVHENHGRFELLQDPTDAASDAANPAAEAASNTVAGGGTSTPAAAGGTSTATTAGGTSTPTATGGTSTPTGAGGSSTSAMAEDTSFGHSVKRAVQNHWLLFPVLLVAVALRAPNLNRSLWIDEIYSVSHRGSMSVGNLITTTSDPHPPLYYLTLKGWMTVFGQSEVAVRALSLLFGIASIGAVYLLGQRLYDRHAGLFAALLMTVSSFQIQYAQTARMYTMLVFFGTLSTYFFVREFDDHSVVNRLGYVAMTVGMLLTHVYGSFVVLGQLLYLGVRFANDWDFAQVKQWTVTQGIAGCLFAPWFAFVAAPSYLLGEGQETRWLSEPGLAKLRQVLLAYSGVPTNYPKYAVGSVSFQVGVLAASIFFMVFLWRLYAERGRGLPVSGSALSVALLAGLVGAPYVVSNLVIPLFEVRYMIFGFVAVALLVGKTIADIDYRPGQTVVLFVVLGLFLAMVPSYHAASPSEDWDQTAELIEGDLEEDSLIVYNPAYTKDAAEFYLSDDALSTADSAAVQPGRGPPDGLTNTTHEQVWVVNIRGENLGVTDRALSDSHTVERNDTVGNTAIRLIEYRKTGATTADGGTANATTEGNDD